MASCHLMPIWEYVLVGIGEKEQAGMRSWQMSRNRECMYLACAHEAMAKCVGASPAIRAPLSRSGLQGVRARTPVIGWTATRGPASWSQLQFKVKGWLRFPCTCKLGVAMWGRISPAQWLAAEAWTIPVVQRRIAPSSQTPCSLGVLPLCWSHVSASTPS